MHQEMGNSKRAFPFLSEQQRPVAIKGWNIPLQKQRTEPRPLCSAWRNPTIVKCLLAKSTSCDSLQSQPAVVTVGRDDSLLPNQSMVKTGLCVGHRGVWFMWNWVPQGLLHITHSMPTDNTTLFPIFLPILPWLKTSAFSLCIPGMV